MKAWIIFCIAIVISPAFGQTASAKTYVWTHPWFKSEVKSPTPPTWPYRVIEEKNGIVKVEVTPPEAQTAVEPKPTPPTPPSTFDTDWPFTVSTGELGCKRLGDLRLVTLTVVNGETYALNGAARSRIKEYGWRDGDEIWKRDPQHPDMRVSSNIIDKGISLCGPQQAFEPTPPTPAPQPKASVTVPTDKKEACKKMGLLGKAIAEVRQRGASRQVAEVAMENLLKQGGATQDGIELGKDIVRSVYSNKLTTANAEEIVAGACEVMMYTAELQKNK